MNTRLHLENDKYMVEWYDNKIGLIRARAFRKKNADFKGKRIKRITQTQANLSKINPGYVYYIGGGWPQCCIRANMKYYSTQPEVQKASR